MTPLLQKNEYTFDRVFRLAMSLLLLVGIVWVLHHLSAVLLPFVAGFLGAYLLHPLVNKVQKWVNNRVTAVAIVLLGLVLLCCIAIAFIVPMIASQMSDMARIIQVIVSTSETPSQIRGIVTEEMWQAAIAPLSQDTVLETLRKEQVWQTMWLLLQKLAPGVLGIFSGIFTTLGKVLSLGIVLLYLVFILIDLDTVQKEVEGLIPKQWRKTLLSFVRDINDAMSVYFRNRFVIAIIQGILFAAGLTILNVPMGIVLGLSIGMASMIPYAQLLGIIPALLFGVLSAIDTGSNVLMISGLIAGLFLLVQLLDDAVLTPRFMGKATGLSPAIILLSVSIWGKLLGLLGLIIAIPVTCVLLSWYKQVNR